MKLVLLPGLHGSGRLFEPFIDALNSTYDVSTIELPSGDNQSYEFITEHVRQRLPQNDEFILLAESFSGPIAYKLLLEEVSGIISVVFVATFLTRPSVLTTLASTFLPGFVFRRSFATDLAVKALIIGPDAGADLTAAFWAACEEAGFGVIKKRLKSVASLSSPIHKISKPCHYLQAERDFLVPGHNYLVFQKHFENIKLYRINGPHLILQSRPGECAKVICEIAGL